MITNRSTWRNWLKGRRLCQSEAFSAGSITSSGPPSFLALAHEQALGRAADQAGSVIQYGLRQP
jgi:hypothetical protein